MIISCRLRFCVNGRARNQLESKELHLKATHGWSVDTILIRCKTSRKLGYVLSFPCEATVLNWLGDESKVD